MNKYYSENNYLHYTTCHEDVEIVLKYVSEKNKNALSIASAGDNTLALLTKGFDKVYAIDNNPSQLALLKLKAKAIQMLSYDDFLILLGVKKGLSQDIYQKISSSLEPAVKEYFDNHLFLFKKGLYLSGKFDHYLRMFAKYILPLVNSKKNIKKFLEFDNITEQQQFYLTNFNTKRYQKLFKIFFSEKNMKKRGRDQAYFEYVEGDIANFLYKRVEKGFFNVLNKDNPYIQIPLCGSFISLPFYLKEENYMMIKKNIHKLVYLEGDFSIIKDLDLAFDYFNLSDIFEYVPISKFLEYTEIIYDKASDNARLIFWNMMVKRKIEDKRFIQINTKIDFEQDKVFYYSNQYVYEVKK